MVWVLIWMQLVSGQSVEYYQLGTFKDEKSCVEALSKATILVTQPSSTVDCLKVEVQ